jgi:hypothetical protein
MELSHSPLHFFSVLVINLPYAFVLMEVSGNFKHISEPPEEMRSGKELVTETSQNNLELPSTLPSVSLHTAS